MASLWQHFLAWRHSRGFGIHSPFAFRFITEVLNQPLPYYAYKNLGSARDLRLIFRLTAYFTPQTINIFANDRHTSMILSVVKAANSTTTLAQAAQMVIIVPENEAKKGSKKNSGKQTKELAKIRSAIANAECVLILDMNHFLAWADVFKENDNVMTFTNLDGVGIAVRRHGIPRQDFIVSF